MGQKYYSITRGAVLITALSNAHADALSELAIRNGELLEDDEVRSIAQLRGIHYHSQISTQAPHLTNEFQAFLKKKYITHWEQTYLSVQNDLIDLTNV